MRLLTLLVLQGCWYLDDPRYQRKVQDADGDGGVAERFGGPDCVDDDPSIADCDADGDGFVTVGAGGTDCDDSRADVRPDTPWFRDADGDGHGNAEEVAQGCGEPLAGFSLFGDDCDDTSPRIHPGADETCSAEDEDCDGDPVAGSVDATVAVWPDDDGDGWGDDGVGATLVCEATAGWSRLDGDCDDGDPDIRPDAEEVPGDGVDQDCFAGNEYDLDLDGFQAPFDCDDTRADVYPADANGPGAPEICDGLDNDCDGLVDDDDDEQSPFDQLSWFVDGDGDGHGGPLEVRWCPGFDPGTGYARLPDDCDDELPAVYPGAVEYCNGIDDDCNQVVDEPTAADAISAFLDEDGDGFGGQAVRSCSLAFDLDGDGELETLSLMGGDCHDNLADAYPGAVEVCGDLVRQDCSGAPVDDCDADGVADGADCDPADPAVFPGAVERCDGTDNDCDALVDDDDPDAEDPSGLIWYADLDGDGFGDAEAARGVCSPPDQATRAPGDCDDTVPSAYPGAPELCDGRDNDCDGVVDEAAAGAPRWYFDGDGDGAGDPGLFVNACVAPGPGWGSSGTDCDDRDRTNAPHLAEICDDGRDNDCDGLVDFDDPDAASGTGEIWYRDEDGDGVGAGEGMDFCTSPDPLEWSLQGDDCDDTDPGVTASGLWFEDRDGDGHAGTLGVIFGCPPAGDWYPFADDCIDIDGAIFPGAIEVCNLKDDDCNGIYDDDPDPLDPFAVGGWPDLDGDGDGDEQAAPVFACFAGPQLAATGSDCDDGDPEVSGLAVEVCGDNKDNDCNGQSDEGATWYRDVDQDGFGDPLVTIQSCNDPGSAFAGLGTDCDDGDGSAYPGAPEVCDLVDDDCDGTVDEGCTPPPVSDDCVGWQWPDVDNDGYGARTGTPEFDCSDLTGFAPNPADCNDGSQVAIPNVVDVDPSDVAGILATGSGCTLYRAAPGIYPMTDWGPSGGGTVTFMAADPAQRPVVTGGTGSVGPLVADGSGSLALVDVDVVGAGTYRMLHVSGASAEVILVDVLLDAADVASGIRLQRGTLKSYGAEVLHARSNAGGAGLWIQEDAVPIFAGLTVIDAVSTAATPSSVLVQVAEGDTLDLGPFGVVGGPGVQVEMVDDPFFSGAYSVSFTGLDLRGNVGDALVVNDASSVTVTGAVVLRASGAGISFVNTGLGPSASLYVYRSTLVGNGTVGVQMDSSSGMSFVSINTSIVTDSGDTDVDGGSMMMGCTLSRSLVGDFVACQENNAVSTSPDYFTFTPTLDPRIADMHLRVPLTVDGDDLGAYSRFDPWYDDSDADSRFDGWEHQYGVFTLAASSDGDADGSILSQEYTRGTDPSRADTDGDGVLDGSDNFPLSP